jgi:hypothetical protein
MFWKTTPLDGKERPVLSLSSAVFMALGLVLIVTGVALSLTLILLPVGITLVVVGMAAFLSGSVVFTNEEPMVLHRRRAAPAPWLPHREERKPEDLPEK